MTRAMQLAAVLASKPRAALLETKRLTRELVDLVTKHALDEIDKTFRRRLESDEHRERLAAVYARISNRV